MKYNLEFVNIKYALIESFMIQARHHILEISYSINGQKIDIQIVLLQGTFNRTNVLQTVHKNLPGYDISIKEIYLTKEVFNLNRGEWQPNQYSWLDNVLFSKAEV